ncbi:hypothetical protein JCGZ_24175 [Jatropha curcas]|uniref:Small ribosomal subunit protein bS18c n=1 Tax=Jatropha curcas TaxID=180498 RepID=A0A067JP44_JATCU|nr:hypothetical protein JCGZ_24175 [Jatropha curcas]
MRRITSVTLRSYSSSLSHLLTSNFIKPLSTAAPTGDPSGDKGNPNSFESIDEFESRIFNSSDNSSFYRKLDRIEKARKFPGSRLSEGNSRQTLDGLDESFNSVSDGMGGKLKEAATYFEFDPNEIGSYNYVFRSDMNFHHGSTYDVKDLDLKRPGNRKPPRRQEFEVTTEEVLRKADFRNVRFLAKFITEAGIIIKRSQTGISAKAQRKLAREIKTARAFGLTPFTTMGTKSFVVGKSMENLDEDFEYETYNTVDDANGKDDFVGA